MNETIENNFIYHKPDEKSTIAIMKIREYARNFAYLIDETVPNSREKSLAMTKLEEVAMWANAGIARY